MLVDAVNDVAARDNAPGDMIIDTPGDLRVLIHRAIDVSSILRTSVLASRCMSARSLLLKREKILRVGLDTAQLSRSW